MTHESPIASRHRCPALWLVFTLFLPACQGEPTVSVRPVLSQTLVISAWDHRVANDRRAYGIDLDRRNSPDGTEMGCEGASDFEHRVDGRDGIDNQYAVILLALLEDFYRGPLNDEVRAELEAGRSLLGFEITAPSGPGEDIEAALVSYASSGSLPRPISAQAGDGSLTATVLTRSVAIRSGDALVIELDDVDIPMGQDVGERSIEDVRVRLLLEPDGRIRSADLGGVVTMATVVSVANVIGVAPVDEPSVRVLAMADVRRNPSTGDCDGVSIGLGLSLLPVGSPTSP